MNKRGYGKPLIFLFTLILRGNLWFPYDKSVVFLATAPALLSSQGILVKMTIVDLGILSLGLRVARHLVRKFGNCQVL